ncbi:hypothetical protein A2U01_0100795, partial [Trifolium medium]|nr:hypothetical protein [Trifolium medium]
MVSAICATRERGLRGAQYNSVFLVFLLVLARRAQ